MKKELTQEELTKTCYKKSISQKRKIIVGQPREKKKQKEEKKG